VPGFFVCRQALKKGWPKTASGAGLAVRNALPALPCRLIAGIPEKGSLEKSRHSEIIYSFQIVADSRPQLVHIEPGRWGTSSCQANYFIKFRAGPAFSYSPEKSLNHNGFVKMCRCGMPLEPAFSNQIP
jgi:hypothetical protein